MSYRLNVFRTRKPVSELGVEVYGYKVLNLGRGQDKFKVLGQLSREIALKLNAPSTRYSPGEEDYILIFNPINPPKEIKINSFILRLEIKRESLEKFLSPAKRLLYSLTRQKLEYHEFWRVAYNKYYSLSYDKIVKGRYGEYRVYRGVFYRYEIMDDYVWLVLDPITRVVQNDSVLVMMSKLGVEKIKEMFRKGRYIVASQVKGGVPTFSVRKVLRFRDDLRAGRDEVIEKEGKWYTVKSWYRDYKGLPEIADRIGDDEPLLETEGGMYYALSMTYLVLRTKDIEDESRYLKDEIYLTADRRFGQIERFFNVVNPLHVPKFPSIPKVEFLEEPATFESRNLEPPNLRFGRGKSVDLKDEDCFKNYPSFFKDKLKRYGPAKAKVRFSAKERLALVYPREHLAEEQIKKFYLDLRKAAKKYLYIRLPPRNKLYFWDYSGNDTTEVRRNYSKFKGNVKGVICILSSDDDPLYFEFKRIFQDVPCQMATKDLVLRKYNLPSVKMHLYFNSVLNLVCGLLGKMGVRPWLLDEKLKGDLYIGVDTRPGKVATFTLVNNIGDYIDETRRSIRGSKVEEDTMRDVVVQLIMDNLKALPRGRSIHIIVHRDGDVYTSEEQGLESAIRLLRQRNLEASITLISVRETTPYRIFKYDGNLAPCPSGVFIKLNERMGLLASVGWPLIKQGLARPLLIEVIRNDEPGYTLQEVVKEVYCLSFLHWEGVVKKLKMPITIKYADEYAVFAEKGIDIVGPPL